MMHGIETVGNHRRRKRATDFPPFHTQSCTRPRVDVIDATIIDDGMPVSMMRRTFWIFNGRTDDFLRFPMNSIYRKRRRYRAWVNSTRTLICMFLILFWSDCCAVIYSCAGRTRDPTFSRFWVATPMRMDPYIVFSIPRGGDSMTEKNTSNDGAYPMDDDDAETLDDSYLESLLGSVDVTEGDDKDILDDDNEDDIMIESIMKKMSGRKKMSGKSNAPMRQPIPPNDDDDDDMELAEKGSRDDDQQDVGIDVEEKIQEDLAENVGEDAVVPDSNVATDQPSEDAFTPVDSIYDERYSLLSREQLLQSPVIQPNALYRFLLRQGSFGQVLVMLCVLISEWFSLYVPPLTKLVSLLLARFLPQSVEDDYLYKRPMKKLSRKERMLQSKYDDELALQQLKGLDKKAAKYRYVSDDFLRRHELGPYSKTKVKSLNDFTSLLVKEQKGRKGNDALLTTKVSSVDRANDDDDLDWVVEALTSEKNPTPRPFFQPSLSIGSSSSGKGASIGIEFGFGSTTPSDNYDRRSVIARAVATDERRRRRNLKPSEKSSNGVGTAKDSILDKFRDLTGTDSVMLSRSLLGAYPGDAVSIQEAASPEGVMDLARKYGWGEWSEDDDVEETNDWNGVDSFTGPKTKRTRRGSKKKKEKQPSIDDFDFDFDDFTPPPTPELPKPRPINMRQPKSTLLSSSALNTRNRGDKRKAPSQRNDEPFSISSILERGNRRADVNDARKVPRMIRPATELLTDRREQLLSKLQERHRQDEG